MYTTFRIAENKNHISRHEKHQWLHCFEPFFLQLLELIIFSAKMQQILYTFPSIIYYVQFYIVTKCSTLRYTAIVR